MAKDSKQLKSAYELAMERLEAEDAKQGRQRKSLSEKQKAEIGELKGSVEDLEKLVFREDANAQLLGFGQLGTRILPDDEEIGFGAHAGLQFPAGPLDADVRLLAGKARKGPGNHD